MTHNEYEKMFENARKQFKIFEKFRELDLLSELCKQYYKMFETVNTQKYTVTTDTKFEFKE